MNFESEPVVENIESNIMKNSVSDLTSNSRQRNFISENGHNVSYPISKSFNPLENYVDNNDHKNTLN